MKEIERNFKIRFRIKHMRLRSTENGEILNENQSLYFITIITNL